MLTHDYCMKIARQYSSLTTMRKEQSAIVKKLYKTGWIDECLWLPSRKRKAVAKYSLLGDFICVFNSLSEAASTINSKCDNISQNINRVCRGKKPSAYGFVWRHADFDNIHRSKQTPVPTKVEAPPAGLT